MARHLACAEALLPARYALSKSEAGVTVLMAAAAGGHTACVEILLPISDVLAKDEHGVTASGPARANGHKILANFIGACTRAMSEVSTLKLSTALGGPEKIDCTACIVSEWPIGGAETGDAWSEG